MHTVCSVGEWSKQTQINDTCAVSVSVQKLYRSSRMWVEKMTHHGTPGLLRFPLKCVEKKNRNWVEIL